MYDAARAVRGIPGLGHELVNEPVADAEGEGEEECGVGDLQWWKCLAMRERQEIEELAIGRAREELLPRGRRSFWR
jgi:hypothetical protein